MTKEPRFRAEPFGARKASAGRTEEISGPKEKKKKASWLASVPGIGRWKIKLLGQRRKKQPNKHEYPKIKSLSLPSLSYNHGAASPPLPGESRNKCLSSEPRNFCNLPAAGRALFIRLWEGGGCVLQFLPCQPSILERMKQPWRIWAAAADLSCWPEDPCSHGATAFSAAALAPA